MKIKEMIKNKKVLFIPVFSMRSYETGKYKLNCDGNMARILSMIYNSDAKCIHISIPSMVKLDDKDYSEFLEKLEEKGIREKVTFLPNFGYGDNAKDTRDSSEIYEDFINCDYMALTLYDVIIAEPQTCVEQLIADESIDNGKIIYWCVASETINFSPWFTRDYKERDKNIASKVKTACATQSQVEYLKGNAYKDEFYNADFSDVKIIFFPFRLSDPSYKASTLKEMLERLNKEANNFKVIITDPNESDEANKLLEIPNVIKTDANFAIYLSILKGKPIIPYFENANEVKHISIEEMVKYECNIICYENEELPDSNNIIKVQDDEAFYMALKKLVNEK